MAYCTATQVQAEFKSVDFSASGASITTTKVNTWIEEADAEIDAVIGTVYSTPVTAESALIVLRTISIELVSARIKRILPTKTGSTAADQGGKEPDLEKQARAKLERIVQGKMLLKDAAKRSSGNGVSSFAVSAGKEHVFDKDRDQW